jgi:hypothetical protein
MNADTWYRAELLRQKQQEAQAEANKQQPKAGHLQFYAPFVHDPRSGTIQDPRHKVLTADTHK